MAGVARPFGSEEAIVIDRPTREDDHAGWQKYHESQADLIARQPPGADLAAKLGQLMGEMDNRSAALSDKIAGFRADSYQAGRQYASLPEPAWGQIDFSKPPTIHRRDDFERGVADYQKERNMPERSREDIELSRSAPVPEGLGQRTTAASPDVVKYPYPEALAREAATIRDAPNVPVSGADLALANAYWNGRREGFNEVREGIVRSNPSLSAELPPSIRTDEIVVRQQVLEQERPDRSFALAR